MNKFNPKKYNYNVDRILHYFGLTISEDSAPLAQLLNVAMVEGAILPAVVEEQRQKLAREGDMWNEEELKMHFLSFVFKFSETESPPYIKLFYERPLSATVQGTPLSVTCDAFLASSIGFNTPQKPYFFLQEFKKGKETADDAEGQLLVAMLIARTINDDQKPIYGCYLLGRHWHFVALNHNTYCFSRPYDSAQVEDLLRIFAILKKIKDIVI